MIGSFPDGSLVVVTRWREWLRSWWMWEDWAMVSSDQGSWRWMYSRGEIALPWQLTAAERRTDLKVDSHDMIGFRRLWRNLSSQFYLYSPKSKSQSLSGLYNLYSEWRTLSLDLDLNGRSKHTWSAENEGSRRKGWERERETLSYMLTSSRSQRESIVEADGSVLRFFRCLVTNQNILDIFNLTMTPVEQLLTWLQVRKCNHYIVLSQIPQLNKKSIAQVMAAFC